MLCVDKYESVSLNGNHENGRKETVDYVWLISRYDDARYLLFLCVFFEPNFQTCFIRSLKPVKDYSDSNGSQWPQTLIIDLNISKSRRRRNKLGRDSAFFRGPVVWNSVSRNNALSS